MAKPKKPAPVSLAQLRAAAPKPWKVEEEAWRFSGTDCFWTIEAGAEAAPGTVSVSHSHRQTARRAALAALRALKGEK